MATASAAAPQAPAVEAPPKKQISLTIDGRQITVPDGTTIWDAAQQLNINIPVVCHKPGLNPVGVCRVCTVEVKGARVFAASCVRPVENGMDVKTTSDRLEKSRRTLVEMLLSDHPVPCKRHQETSSCELEVLGERMGLVAKLEPGKPPVPFQSKFHGRAQKPDPNSPNKGADQNRGMDLSSFIVAKGPDISNPDIAIDHSACVLCDRCVRACTEVKHNNVIGRMGKGYTASISFDTNKPMKESSCVNCGECMVSCPTGAITSRATMGGAGVTGVQRLDGQAIPVEQLIQMPLFSGLSPEFLKRNQGSIVTKRFEPGQIICREGEFGSTAFFILEGKCDVYIGTPQGHVKSDKKEKESRGGLFGMFRKFSHRLAGRKEDVRSDAGTKRFIPVDGPVDLPMDNPVGILQAGDLFGEMTCMTFQPRSATVRGSKEGPVVVVEMLRNVLQILLKNKRFKDQLDKNYRERALAQHLRSVPILAGLEEQFIKQLKERVELLNFDAGQKIVRQGDPADAFYLIRVGCVKVGQERPGGEMILSYLSRGEYFGEMGLLKGGKRTASCTALDHVEVVKIKKGDFDFMLDWYDGLREKFVKVAEAREAQAKVMQERAPNIPLDNFLEQGLMHAQSLLMLDLERCTRCDECVRACSQAHDGVTRLVREGLRFDKYLIPTSCRSCLDPLCMVGCPVGSIRRKETLEIIIEDWCIGCGLCSQQCPYGNITMHAFEVQVDDPDRPGYKKAGMREKATSCDLCTELKEPSCVYACPHDAAHRVKALDFFTEYMQGVK